jgi:hypothetical protein
LALPHGIAGLPTPGGGERSAESVGWAEPFAAVVISHDGTSEPLGMIITVKALNRQ